MFTIRHNLALSERGLQTQTRKCRTAALGLEVGLACARPRAYSSGLCHWHWQDRNFYMYSNLRLVTAAGGTTPLEDDDTDDRLRSPAGGSYDDRNPATRSMLFRIAMRLLSLLAQMAERSAPLRVGRLSTWRGRSSDLPFSPDTGIATSLLTCQEPPPKIQSRHE